ncbi:ATP-binding protein [Nocardiopsis sp. EMB25]|uniref:ATP-binding protein n=1 Tax=Nocardiopsis sp. EMB25 TaxID=2835867 RepID=UPI002283D8E8|nr:ATP-binding protein [Nocardiopsis sp. EMB25]MCY9783313.1 ATP-binding protein [Nocardiopsis sp. EMB25]
MQPPLRIPPVSGEGVLLPRRISYDDPNKSGLLCGSDTAHLSLARRWAAQVTRTTPSAAHPLVASLAELHANALRHSASGLQGGQVRIEIERCRLLFLLHVTDDGPRPGAAPTVPVLDFSHATEGPSPELVECGYGLAVVEAMALCWDFSRGSGGELTVSAAFDRSGRTRTR